MLIFKTKGTNFKNIAIFKVGLMYVDDLIILSGTKEKPSETIRYNWCVVEYTLFL